MSYRLEFRIPISPTSGFFSQVRFFNAALRRLGGIYEKALLTVVVGDKSDLPSVIAANGWSKEQNIRWIRVPDEIFDKYSFYGTSDSRFLIEPEGDLVIFSDADTVLVRDVSPALDSISAMQGPALAGHMAHWPPVGEWNGYLPSSHHSEYWPNMFRLFEMEPPAQLYQCSIPIMNGQSCPPSPAYFNYGFVIFNPAALAIFRNEIFPMHDRLNGLFDTFMRCQIACTLIGYRHDMHFVTLSSAFNVANDILHVGFNVLKSEDVRVIHYLRTDEVDRSKIFLPENFDAFLNAHLENGVNMMLQAVARQVKEAMRD